MEKKENLNRRTYEALYIAKSDLGLARWYASQILKNGWHLFPWARARMKYMHQSAYTTSMIISYSRPFVQSRGRLKLPGKTLQSYNNEQRHLHKKVLKLRNSTYAHSDSEIYAVRPIKIGASPSAIQYLPVIRFSREEALMLVEMIDAISKDINSRLSSLIDLVSEFPK